MAKGQFELGRNSLNQPFMKRVRGEEYDKIMTNFDLDENMKYVVRFKFTSEKAD